jgi:hypothetical protein
MTLLLSHMGLFALSLRLVYYNLALFLLCLAVTQLASSFPTFFEKLLSILGRLAETFPQYEAIVELFEGVPPPRMHGHLENVYLDLMLFLQLAAKVFTASNGSKFTRQDSVSGLMIF